MDDRTESNPSTPLPAGWDEAAGFRETYLCHFTRPGAATAMSIVADLLYDHAMESARYWPDPKESSTRWQARAAVADLRHLQGVLVTLGQSRSLSSLPPEDEEISGLAGRQAAEVARIAEILEAALGPVPA